MSFQLKIVFLIEKNSCPYIVTIIILFFISDSKSGSVSLSDDSSDDSDDFEEENDENTSHREAMVQLSLSKASSALGAWEQHTKVCSWS